ncbi:MAG TPA: LysM peptidoglycan-binding domain-containing protein [Aggregatilineales bacterium]|jgi:LysM repeat protein|nr:LysM peptidoglycan-binding domain-containing protein [Aggregatilineales bacterium]
MRRAFVLFFALIVLGVAANVSAAPVEQTGPVVHIVQWGENLYRISIRYGVTVQSIVTTNSIPNPNLIFAGQRLVIPVGGTVPQPTQPPVPGATQVPPPTGETAYVVRYGDTLGRIARQFGTTVAAIAQRNSIVNVNLIFVGQRLIIPTGGTVIIPTAQPGVTPVPTSVQPPPSTGNPLTGFALGGHVSGFNAQAMRDARMTWVKFQYRFNLGDNPANVKGLIDQARGNGFKVLLGIVGDRGQLAANPGGYYQQFAQFLGGVAALGPDAIEVWNEPNIDREWPAGQINGSNYTQMLAQAYASIKAANGNVAVISGAPAPTGFFGGTCQSAGCDDNIFIRQMRDAGAANYMDCVGLHYNEGILPPSARSGDPRGNSTHYTRYYPTMVDVYAGTFPTKPLCFTELGYLTSEGLGPLPAGWEWAAGTSLAEQAQWLGDAVRLSRQSGRIRLLIVWNVDFTQYGADPQAGYSITRGGVCTACASLAAAMQ